MGRRSRTCSSRWDSRSGSSSSGRAASRGSRSDFSRAPDASDELCELRDELGARFFQDLEDRADAELRDAHLGEDLDDVVELAVRQGHELVLREPVAVQILLALCPQASLYILECGLPHYS